MQNVDRNGSGPVGSDAEPVSKVLAGMHALVAEDNVANQLVVQEMLRFLGATSVVANDGLAALDRLDQESFDVLLIDIEMPRLSGLDLIAQLRTESDPLPQTTIIALTAYVLPEHRRAISRAGADGVIPKPLLSIEAFGNAVSGIMERRRSKGVAPDPVEPLPDERREEEFDPGVLNRLIELCGADRVSHIVTTAEADIDAAIGALIEALSLGDPRAAKFQGHSLAGMAGAVGARGLERQARAIDLDPEAALRRRSSIVSNLRDMRGSTARWLAGDLRRSFTLLNDASG
ncbi:MAG: response regulator [Pseudomonadota bacterium]